MLLVDVPRTFTTAKALLPTLDLNGEGQEFSAARALASPQVCPIATTANDVFVRWTEHFAAMLQRFACEVFSS